MTAEEWSDAAMHCFGMVMDGRARPTGVRQRGTEATMLLILNSHHDVVQFKLPTHGEGRTWTRLADTNVPDADDTQTFDSGTEYGVTGRSLLLFALS